MKSSSKKCFLQSIAFIYIMESSINLNQLKMLLPRVLPQLIKEDEEIRKAIQSLFPDTLIQKQEDARKAFVQFITHPHQGFEEEDEQEYDFDDI